MYVGNLAYEVKWPALKEFMRQAGEVIFADVLLLSNGKSKGCGIVEYASREEAQRAVETLSNQSLMGRLVFVREDRESEPRYASHPPVGGFNSRRPPPSNAAPGTQLWVGNLPYSSSWQDLKDLFRDAGNVTRADILIGLDGRPKGSGIVAFETAQDAQEAITKFNGYEWHGRPLEVREDRFFKAASTNNDDKNSDFTKGTTGDGSPSAKIYVDNLPWATTNEDLVELFQTVGPVTRAEIKYLSNGRAQGAGVVEFENADDAATSIEKFNGYNYGNRDLVISYVSYARY